MKEYKGKKEKYVYLLQENGNFTKKGDEIIEKKKRICLKEGRKKIRRIKSTAVDVGCR